MKTIKITKKIIDAANSLITEGSRDTVHACFTPVSLALSQQSDYNGWFTVTKGDKLEAICGTKEETIRFFLPNKIASFAKDWLNGKTVDPIDFKVKNKNVDIFAIKKNKKYL
jgi:hypothetical protein